MLDLDWRPMVWADPRDYGLKVRQVLPLVDTVVGGDAEFLSAGISPQQALKLGPSLIVVKHGSAGASVIEKGHEQHLPGIPVVVTCGLGAGDAFLAAFAASVYEGRNSIDATARANAAGAIVVTRPMCSLSMPTRVELDTFLQSSSTGGAVVGGLP